MISNILVEYTLELAVYVEEKYYNLLKEGELILIGLFDL